MYSNKLKHICLHEFSFDVYALYCNSENKKNYTSPVDATTQTRVQY